MDTIRGRTKKALCSQGQHVVHGCIEDLQCLCTCIQGKGELQCECVRACVRAWVSEYVHACVHPCVCVIFIRAASLID